MDILLNVLSVLVIICLIGALLYFTKAMKAEKEKKAGKTHEEKNQNLRMAGVFCAAYLLLNLLRLYLENNLT